METSKKVVAHLHVCGVVALTVKTFVIAICAESQVSAVPGSPFCCYRSRLPLPPTSHSGTQYGVMSLASRSLSHTENKIVCVRWSE